MFRFITKFILFLSSYCFLYILIGVKNYQNELIYYSSFGLVVISIILVLNILHKAHKRADKIITIKEIDNDNSNNLTYLLTYIIPFLAVEITTLNDIIIQFILFVFIGFLYVNSSMLQINPTLNLLGYKLYKIIDKNNDKYYLISRERVKKNTQVKVYKESPLLIT